MNDLVKNLGKRIPINSRVEVSIDKAPRSAMWPDWYGNKEDADQHLLQARDTRKSPTQGILHWGRT